MLKDIGQIIQKKFHIQFYADKILAKIKGKYYFLRLNIFIEIDEPYKGFLKKMYKIIYKDYVYSRMYTMSQRYMHLLLDYYNFSAVEACRDINFNDTIKVSFATFFNVCHKPT